MHLFSILGNSSHFVNVTISSKRLFGSELLSGYAAESMYKEYLALMYCKIKNKENKTLGYNIGAILVLITGLNGTMELLYSARYYGVNLIQLGNSSPSH